MEGIYKCWYSPFIVDSTSHGMTLEQRNRRYNPPRKREMGVCYATSKDGVKWHKPDLGLVEYNGNKQNNIVWRGPHGAWVFKNLNEKNPNRRYKMIYKHIRKGNHGIGNNQGNSLAVSYSPDGIHWSNKIKIVNLPGDTHNNALWVPALNSYAGIPANGKKERDNKKGSA